MKPTYNFDFFFFQAEDGIRDVAVTGVQTCALPISSVSAWGPAAPAWAQRPGFYSFVRCDHGLTHVGEALLRRLGHGLRGLAPLHATLDDLQRMDGMLVVVLRVLLEPPAATGPDLHVLGEPT